LAVLPPQGKQVAVYDFSMHGINLLSSLQHPVVLRFCFIKNIWDNKY